VTLLLRPPLVPGASLLGHLAGAGRERIGAVPLDIANRYVSGSPVSSGSANAKGGYVDLVTAASNTIDIYGLYISLYNNHATRDCLFDISVGESGVEQVIVSNLLWSMPPAGNVIGNIYLPLFVRRGQKLSVRQQCSTATSTATMYLTATNQNPFPYLLRSCETWGAATGDSGGTGLDPGGSAGTFGAWAPLTTSCTRRVRQVVIAIGNQNNGARANAHWRLQLGIGGAGAESSLIDYHLASNITGDHVNPAFVGPFALDIPAGSRVSARCNCDIIDATDRLIDVAAYGFSE